VHDVSGHVLLEQLADALLGLARFGDFVEEPGVLDGDGRAKAYRRFCDSSLNFAWVALLST